ncbi:MAG: diacylglycerol/polyprenol kinase family protein [Candidatus Longimicrobiales bacterium M2_2A_002]
MTGADRARKAIHAGLSLAAATVVLVLEPVLAAIVLATATMAALAVELARRLSPAAVGAFDRLEELLKPREATGLTGATLLSIGFTAAAVVFPGDPALAGILLAGLADPAAALVGRRYGRVRYPGGKSAAGSVAFLVVALALGLALGLGPGTAILVAMALTAVEALTLPIDDNLYLPVAGAALVMMAV